VTEGVSRRRRPNYHKETIRIRRTEEQEDEEGEGEGEEDEEGEEGRGGGRGKGRGRGRGRRDTVIDHSMSVFRSEDMSKHDRLVHRRET